jgi:hypothetical protein
MLEIFRQITKELVSWYFMGQELTKIKCRVTFLVKIMNIIGGWKERKKERKLTCK